MLMVLGGLIIVVIVMTFIRIVIYYCYLWGVKFDESINMGNIANC
jgi:hypothetical protein